MKQLLEQQRQNCFRALGNLPKNLQRAYYIRIMGAKVPDTKGDFGQVIVYGSCALGGALVATVIFALV